METRKANFYQKRKKIEIKIQLLWFCPWLELTWKACQHAFGDVGDLARGGIPQPVSTPSVHCFFVLNVKVVVCNIIYKYPRGRAVRQKEALCCQREVLDKELFYIKSTSVGFPAHVDLPDWPGIKNAWNSVMQVPPRGSEQPRGGLRQSVCDWKGRNFSLETWLKAINYNHTRATRNRYFVRPRMWGTIPSTVHHPHVFKEHRSTNL